MFGKQTVFKVILYTTILLGLLSCKSKVLGYGVLLWSPEEENIDTGSLVPVLEDSSIRDVYVIETGRGNETMDVPRTRIAFFRKEKDALAYAGEYGPYRHLFAKTLKDALAIRIEPDEGSERVYKLRQGQVIKVIGKLDEEARVADHDGFWFIVMTEEGVRGYTFSYHLDIYDSTRSGGEAAVQAPDPKLEAFLSRVYRPEYFRIMLDKKRIDLRHFTSDYGMYPNAEARRVKIILPEGEFTVQYETIEKIGGDRYAFTGSSLQIITHTMNRASVIFSDEKTEINETFYYIDGIEDIRTAEIERRDTLKMIFARLEPLQSGAYGILSFNDEGGFTWKEYERLTPTIVPSGAGETGTLRFDHFLGDTLEGLYDGVITFAFKGPGNPEVYFLYTLTDDGLKLVYVQKNDISEGIVLRENPSPIVLFFSP